MRSSWLRRLAPWLLSLGLLTSGAASAQLQVRFIEPSVAKMEGDFQVLVEIQSTYQLSSVQAEFGGRTFPMTVSNRSSATVSIDGVPYGEHRLTVTARDVQGTEATVTRLLEVDRPPRLVVSSPAGSTVARPSVQLTASCEDDGPQGCEVYVEALAADPRSPRSTVPGPPSMSAAGELDQELCLAEYEGKRVTFSLQARAGPQSSAWVSRSVDVQTRQRLVPAVQVPGEVLDFDAQRVLFVDAQQSAQVLDRTSGQIETLLNFLGRNSYLCGLGCSIEHYTGYLAPGGAVFISRNSSLIQIKDGQRIDVAEFPLAMSGPVSSYHRFGGNLLAYEDYTKGWMLRDLLTGTTVQLPSGVKVNGISEDGTAVANGLRTIYRYRDGQLETLLTLTEGGLEAPIADGDDVVFQRNRDGIQETVLLRAGQQQVLGDTTGLLPVSSLLAKGWVAFVRPGGGVAQVWLRSPAGTDEQVTQWGVSSTPLLLGPDGRVVYEKGGQYYLSGPGSPSVPFASATVSRFKWVTGQPFMALGDTVFAIDPAASDEPLTCPSPPPSPGTKSGGCSAAGDEGTWLVSWMLLILMARRLQPQPRRKHASEGEGQQPPGDDVPVPRGDDGVHALVQQVALDDSRHPRHDDDQGGSSVRSGTGPGRFGGVALCGG